MAESEQYHYWKDGNEYDVVVYLDDEGKGNGYGHGIRTETTIKHWQGNEFVTHEDIYGNVVYTDVTSPDGSHTEKYQDATGRWWRDSIGPDGKGVRETIDEWDGNYPDDSNENVGNWHTPEEGETPIGRISQGQGEEPSPYDGIEDKNYAEDHLPPPYPYGQENHTEGRLPLPDTGIEGEEDHTGGRLPLPDPVEEPAPAPGGIQGVEHFVKGRLPLPGLVEEEPLVGQQPEAEPPVQPIPPPPSLTPEDLAKQQAEERARAEEAQNPTPPADPPPPTSPQDEPPVDPNADRQPPEEPPPSPTPEDLGIQEHYAKDHGLPGLVEEPAPTPRIQGEDNLAKGHLPGLVDEEPPTEQSPQAEPPVQPNSPAEPPVEQSPTSNPPAVPGGEGGIPGMGIPYQDFIPLYPMDQDPATGEWRNAQPEEIPKPDQQPEGNDPTQLDPNLLDPIAPGPTLDTGLVERIEQSPGLVDRVNQDPTVAEALERDPTQLDQIEQDLGVAEQRPMEPSGGTDLGGATDLSLTDAGSTAGQDGHDHDDGVFEGI